MAASGEMMPMPLVRAIQIGLAVSSVEYSFCRSGKTRRKLYT